MFSFLLERKKLHQVGIELIPLRVELELRSPLVLYVLWSHIQRPMYIYTFISVCTCEGTFTVTLLKCNLMYISQIPRLPTCKLSLTVQLLMYPVSTWQYLLPSFRCVDVVVVELQINVELASLSSSPFPSYSAPGNTYQRKLISQSCNSVGISILHKWEVNQPYKVSQISTRFYNCCR